MTATTKSFSSLFSRLRTKAGVAALTLAAACAPNNGEGVSYNRPEDYAAFANLAATPVRADTLPVLSYRTQHGVRHVYQDRYLLENSQQLANVQQCNYSNPSELFPEGVLSTITVTSALITPRPDTTIVNPLVREIAAMNASEETRELCEEIRRKASNGLWRM